MRIEAKILLEAPALDAADRRIAERWKSRRGGCHQAGTT
jgi:hypothetical protein